MLLRVCLRAVSRLKCSSAVGPGEIIAEYPDDQPFPSYLLLYFEQGKPLHVVVGKDERDGACYVVTAYEPDIKLWNDDFRTRRKK